MLTAALVGVLDEQQAMLGHERVLDDDVLGAGAGEADDVPGVIDGKIRARDQIVGGAWPIAFGFGRNLGIHEDPLRMIAAAGERPAPAQAIAARLAPRRARRREAGARDGPTRRAPDVFLSGRRIHAEDDLMVGKYAVNPACRAAAAAERGGDAKPFVEVDLESAVTPGLQPLEQFGVAQIAHGFVGYAPERLGLGRAFAQHRHQRLRARQQLPPYFTRHRSASRDVVGEIPEHRQQPIGGGLAEAADGGVHHGR